MKFIAVVAFVAVGTLSLVGCGCAFPDAASCAASDTAPTPTSSATPTPTLTPSRVTCDLPTHQRGSMNARIDGVAWSSACVSMMLLSYDNALLAISLSGTDDGTGNSLTFRQVNMSFAAGGTGTFPMNGSLNINSSAITGPQPGTVTITTFTSTNMVGTFSFVTGGKTVSDGAFNITFAS